MSQRGSILIELLVACTLMSLAATGLYAGLSQAVKIDRAVKNISALYDPLKILWLRSSKDLRNAVSLRGYKFLGKQDEMVFPSLVERGQLANIRYFVKDEKLFRSEQILPDSFVKKHAKQSILLTGVERVKFEYAYLDEEDRLLLKPVWLEEPYFGIPRAVRIEIKLKASAKVFFRLIAVPQGRWGHLTEKEEAVHA